MQKWIIARRVDEENRVIHLVMFTPRVMVIKMPQIAYFMYFLWIQQKVRSSFGKISKCFYKALFGPFRKYYGLRSSELPLAKFRRLKMQDFSIPLLTQQFFWYSQLSPKPTKQIIFCKNLIMSSMCTFIAQTVANVLLLSAENTNK